MAANELEVNSFLTKFKHLSNAGFEASLRLNCINGHTTVSLDVKLGPLQESSSGSLREITTIKLKRKRSPAYYRRQEARRNARLTSTSQDFINAAEEVAADVIRTESYSFRAEVTEAENVVIESSKETEPSVNNGEGEGARFRGYRGSYNSEVEKLDNDVTEKQSRLGTEKVSTTRWQQL